MQDRFKFRVWDKINKEWFKRLIPLLDIENGFLADFFNKQEAYNRRYLLEQCTGLKDKNGKLIYEGDIVRINGWWDACGPAGYNENKTVVKWNEEFAGFEPMCIYDCDCQVYHEAEECEVIGNIHENADLLGADR